MIAPKAIPRVALQISPMVLALLLMSAAASGQGYDDVHVAPRTSASDRTKALSPSGPTSSAKPLRKDVDLVLVPVTVTDPMNRPILDLGAGNGWLCHRVACAGHRAVAPSPSTLHPSP